MASGEAVATELNGPVSTAMSLVTNSRLVPRSLLEKFLLDEQHKEAMTHVSGELYLRAEVLSWHMSDLAIGHATPERCLDAGTLNTQLGRVDPFRSSRAALPERHGFDVLDLGEDPIPSSVSSGDACDGTGVVDNVHKHGGLLAKYIRDSSDDVRVSNVSWSAPQICSVDFYAHQQRPGHKKT